MNGNDCLEYRDVFVSVFLDTEKCLAIFVNDKGNSKVISWDDNFYSVNDDVVAYEKMLRDSLIDNKTNDIRDVDREDYERLLGDYIAYVEKQLEDSDDELDWDYLEREGIRKYDR